MKETYQLLEFSIDLKFCVGTYHDVLTYPTYLSLN